MSYDWHDYLIFAQNLNKNPAFVACVCEEETLKRNIVSRAYFSAFHYAKRHAETTTRVPFPEAGVHSAVKRWYKDKKQFKILNDLRELVEWRDNCDYKDNIPTSNLNTLVEKSLKAAERVHHYF
jgi:uncharacterized protein (UPF0332 family)